MDQQMHSLVVIRKAYKWYKKLFFRFMLQLPAQLTQTVQDERRQPRLLKFCAWCHDTTVHIVFPGQPDKRYLDSIVRLTGRDHFLPRRHMTDRVGGERQRRSVMFVIRVTYGQRKEPTGNLSDVPHFLACAWISAVLKTITLSTITQCRLTPRTLSLLCVSLWKAQLSRRFVSLIISLSHLQSEGLF